MVRFRILHVSDLHIGAKAGLLPLLSRKWGPHSIFGSHEVGRLEALNRLVEDLTSAREFDHLVVTGDLAATGSPEDLKAAAFFLREEGAAIEPSWSNGTQLSASIRKKTLLLPGNHDRYLTWRGDPGGTLFDIEFKGSWRVGWGAQVLRYERKAGVGFAIIGADFSLVNAQEHKGVTWLNRGRGRVSDRTLAALVELTGVVKKMDKTAAVVWCVHFPPQFSFGEPARERVPDQLRLLDDELLATAARAAGVRTILCGHLHQHYCPVGRDVQILCVGTAAACGAAQHIVALHDIVNDSGLGIAVRHRDFEWCEDNRAFVRKRDITPGYAPPASPGGR